VSPEFKYCYFLMTSQRYASAVLCCHRVCPSVRLSVRPSLTSRHCTKTAKNRITQYKAGENRL